MAIVWKELGASADKIPCCMYQGNDGGSLNANHPRSNLYRTQINTSKATSASFTSYGRSHGTDNMCNVDLEKLLDCDYIILLTAGGSDTSGTYNAKHLASTYSGGIDFESFRLGLSDGVTYNETFMDLYFTPKHKVVQRVSATTTNTTGTYFMYLAKVNKEKSVIDTDFKSKKVNEVYMNPATEIIVNTSSYIWYHIQVIPLVSE